MENIVLIGIGGHAKGIVDTIEKQNKYHIVGFADKINEPKKYKGYEVIGDDADLETIFSRDRVKKAFISIGYMGNSRVRAELYEKLKRIGYQLPVIIDPTAAVAENVYIEEGTFIGKNVVVNADAKIGRMCIINDGAIIEHDCSVEDFAHVAVGAVVCGMSRIGEQSFVGANATVIQCVDVGNCVTIGAGSVVLSDVKDNYTVYGIWKKSDCEVV